MTTRLRLTLLNKQKHDRKKFDCGLESVNRYLKSSARLSMERNAAKTYVLVDESSESAQTIVGFYTLAFETFIPPEDDSRFKGYSHRLPGLLLAQMGVDKRYQGKEVASTLLGRVIVEAAKLQQESPAPITGLYINPANDSLIRFYEKQGFIRLADDNGQIRMWLPIEQCIQLYKRTLKTSTT